MKATRVQRLQFTMILLFLRGPFVTAFAVGSVTQGPVTISRTSLTATDNNDDTVARRIIVTGDVQGGYYRSCVINEASRFRKLVGTMSPPDFSSTQAEIYVEGRQKMVDGFIRWCQRGNVGLSQKITVDEVLEEEPTGLYDGFYAATTDE